MAFHKAHNFTIENATFLSSHIEVSDRERWLTMIHNARALEAQGNIQSTTSVYAPRCHPGTRERVLADMLEFVEKPECPILWFWGPAGAGKTCVMRELVDKANTVI